MTDKIECTTYCSLCFLTTSIAHSTTCSCAPSSRESTFVVTLLHFFHSQPHNHMVLHRLSLSPDSQKVMGSNPRPFFVQLALSPCVCVGSLLVVWLIETLTLSGGENVWCGWLVVCVTLSRDKLVTR